MAKNHDKSTGYAQGKSSFLPSGKFELLSAFIHSLSIHVVGHEPAEIAVTNILKHPSKR